MACERGHTHLIVFTHACGYYSRAATISLVDLKMRLLFEGGYYSNKYGIWVFVMYYIYGISGPFLLIESTDSMIYGAYTYYHYSHNYLLIYA